MTAYQVDAAEVAAASAAASATAANIRSSVAAMMAQLQALQATWAGGASASFQNVIAGWQATQIQVEDSLESVSVALSQASSTYTDAEAAASSLFAGS